MAFLSNKKQIKIMSMQVNHALLHAARGTGRRKRTSKMGNLAKIQPNLADRYGIRMRTSIAKIRLPNSTNFLRGRGCCVQELKAYVAGVSRSQLIRD